MQKAKPVATVIQEGSKSQLSQGSVLTHLRCGWIVNDDYYKFMVESCCERILTRAQQLLRWATIWSQYT